MSVQNWQFPKIAGLYHNCRLYYVVYHQKMIIRYNNHTYIIHVHIKRLPHLLQHEAAFLVCYFLIQ